MSGLYWWSPTRQLSTLKVELTSASRAWARLAFRTRRVMRNFGDELSPLAVASAFGGTPRWARPRKASLFAVGSLMDFVPVANAPLVWGTGLRSSPTEAFMTRWRTADPGVLAVRGPLTREELRLPADTPLGDPGLLVPGIIPAQPDTGRILYLPHYRDWNTLNGRAEIASLSKRGFSVIEPSRSPRFVANAISGADGIVSASLHGLILAHAYGRPVVPLAPSGREPNFKYQDHFSAVGVPYNPLPVEAFASGNLHDKFADAQRHVSQARDAALALSAGLYAAAKGHSASIR